MLLHFIQVFTYRTAINNRGLLELLNDQRHVVHTSLNLYKFVNVSWKSKKNIGFLLTSHLYLQENASDYSRAILTFLLHLTVTGIKSSLRFGYFIISTENFHIFTQASPRFAKPVQHHPHPPHLLKLLMLLTELYFLITITGDDWHRWIHSQRLFDDCVQIR